MSISRILRPAVAVAVTAALAATAYFTRDGWLPWLFPSKPAATGDGAEPDAEPVTAPSKIIVNEVAQENMGLTAKALRPQSFWKTITVPGMVVDRPAFSDRAVVTPVDGVVTAIRRVPGDEVRPGETLFTVKLRSDAIAAAQTAVATSTLAAAQARERRKELEAGGAGVAGKLLTEQDRLVAQHELTVRLNSDFLLARGFSPAMVERVAKGETENEVEVPSPKGSHTEAGYEVQELKVELGQQVQAGQTLCLLANHHLLAVEGRAFRDETLLLERTVQEKWPVEVDFQEGASSGWGPVKQEFRVRHLSNTIDPQTRTFAFQMPLDNESRVIEDGGRRQTLWRFRPGQRVRLHVRVEELKDVFVLPADAVTRDGADSFLFTQNVNTFTRHPVRVLLQDRQQAVIANDGTFPAGTFAVQAGAAQLNRMIKAGGGSGLPKGYHMHADGSLHKNEDEGK